MEGAEETSFQNLPAKTEDVILHSAKKKELVQQSIPKHITTETS